MNKFLSAILILSLCVSVIYAQNDSSVKETDEFYCQALKQYLSSLSHQNNGVVESTIIILMKLRRKCPEISYQTTIDSLDALASNGRTSNIRFLASIATRYLQNPEDPGLFEDIRIEDDGQLITMLLDRLE